MLGERIRKLRKQKKMTLETLAGKELTKGMLSLIENNKANPSMESLAYIAEQLEVEVTDLLEDISRHELSELLEKAEELFNKDIRDMEDKHSQLITLIESFVINLTQGYEAARLLEILSRSLYQEKKEGWQELSDRAAKMYNQLNLTGKSAGIGIFRAMVHFQKHNYEQSLQIFLQERANIESNHAFIDPLTRLDLDYHEAIFYFAIGDSPSAIRVMEKAINYSRENRIFYRINDLYRLAAGQAMMAEDEENKVYYLKKLKQYGEFADHTESRQVVELFEIMSLVTNQQKYKTAIEKIDQLLSSMKNYEPWLFLEKGKALHGLGIYEEAIDYLNKVEIPSTVHHPFDLSMFYVGDAYKALTHLELGDRDEALKYAEKAVNNFAHLPSTSFKDFSLQAYSEIKRRA